MESFGRVVAQIQTNKSKKIFQSVSSFTLAALAFIATLIGLSPTSLAGTWVMIVGVVFLVLGIFTLGSLRDSVVVYEDGFEVRALLKKARVAYREVEHVTYVARGRQMDLSVTFRPGVRKARKLKFPVTYYIDFVDNFQYAVNKMLHKNGQTPSLGRMF